MLADSATKVLVGENEEQIAKARDEELPARAEKLFRLAPRLLEDLVGLDARRDRTHRLDERLEEARLRRELVLDPLMAAPLAHDQVEREGGRGGERRHERREGERPERAEQRQDERGRREHDRAREERGPNR